MLVSSLAALFATLVLSSSAAAAPAASAAHADGPIVDLGKYGKYLGTVENNGTVNSWKAIPYAAPPVGDLRFKAPRPPAPQNSTVQDVSADFDGQPTACVQFGTTSFVGVNAGPGQEDCLKAWIWAPAGAKKGDKLAVQVYTHGGGMQNSQSPNNPFGDFVGQDKGIIAVNCNYRLGLLGFWNSESAAGEGETANVGLLDSRFCVDWVHKNIAAFGGDPNNIAISGQSGGGGAIMTQLILYDGKKPNFHKAIPRSIQQYAAYPVKELTTRNDAFANSVNCTASASTKEGATQQLACMRALPAETIRLAALNFSRTTQDDGFSWPGWLPSIDGETLTDQPSRLYAQGKIAKVPVIAAHVTNEVVRLSPNPSTNQTAQARSSIGPLVTEQLLSEVARIYPEPIVNASRDTNTYNDAVFRSFGLSNDFLADGGAWMVARAHAAKGLPSYMLRFNSPEPNPNYEGWYGASHSSDNYYLQNATSSMNATEAAVAHEWRAYVSSFLKHSNPNKAKLSTAPTWHMASDEYRFLPRLVISQQLEATADPSAPTTTGMEIVPPNEWDRLMFWHSKNVTDLTRQ